MIFNFDCALSVGFKKNHCEYSFIRNKKWTVLQSSPFTRFTDDVFDLSANMFSGEDVVGLTDRWAMPNINKLVDDVGYATVFNTWDYTCLSDWWWRIIMKQQIMWFIESKTVTFCARVTYPAMIGQQRARSVQMFRWPPKYFFFQILSTKTRTSHTIDVSICHKLSSININKCVFCLCRNLIRW